jgi:hypothetical protein
MEMDPAWPEGGGLAFLMTMTDLTSADVTSIRKSVSVSGNLSSLSSTGRQAQQKLDADSTQERIRRRDDRNTKR